MKFLLLLLATIGIPALAHADAWHTNYNRARARAKAENKPVLMYFTGSDFCGYCKKLDREALDQRAFENYAAQNLVLLKLDFPARKPQSRQEREQNEVLKMKYRVAGFPTLILLNPNGSPAGEVVYRRGGPRPLIAQIEKTLRRSQPRW